MKRRTTERIWLLTLKTAAIKRACTEYEHVIVRRRENTARARVERLDKLCFQTSIYFILQRCTLSSLGRCLCPVQFTLWNISGRNVMKRADRIPYFSCQGDVCSIDNMYFCLNLPQRGAPAELGPAYYSTVGRGQYCGLKVLFLPCFS